MTRASVATSLAFLISAGSQAGAQELTDSLTIAGVADSVAAELLAHPPPVAGLTIAVNGRGERIFSRAYGVADPASGKLLELTDPQRIGSLTKQFTAAAVLRLVEEGRVSLDAPIQEYLPDFHTQGYKVTIRNLLNHTSGIRSYSAIYGGTPVSRATLLDALQGHPYDFEPGEGYRYNNSGYYLLGVIVEAVTGDSYARHMKRMFFEPLGLESTTYCGYQGTEVPVGYRAVGDDLDSVVLPGGDYLGASGGLCSTVGDLLDWQRALASGDLISSDSYTMMATPSVLASGDTVAYGFGLEIDELDDHVLLSHGGSVTGFDSRLVYFPEDELGVAVLVNTNTPRAGAVEQAVARAALGMERLVRTNLPLTAEERAQYVGTYDLGPIQLRVFEDGENLMLEPTGQSIARLLYQGAGVFLPDVGAEGRIEFRVEAGRATSLTLYQAGRRFDAPRVGG